MKKFAANYVISDHGAFLKNGIVIAKNDGTTIEFINTTNDLKEIAQLQFHNGILVSNFSFRNVNNAHPLSEPEQDLKHFIFSSISKSEQFSIENLIDLGKQIQEQFPEMKIPEIITTITEVLLNRAGFVKENIPGIFLIMGVDLVGLHFTPKSRLKRIL